MRYTIRAHPTRYGGVLYRSRLEATWAAWFDIVGYSHEYEPIDLSGWTPDFRVVMPCGHSECCGNHSILAEVKPYFDIEDFVGHPCMDYEWGDGIPADGGAALGANPTVSEFVIAHGAGGGVHHIDDFTEHDPMQAWDQAKGKTQWKAERDDRICELPMQRGRCQCCRRVRECFMYYGPWYLCPECYRRWMRP